MAIKYLAGGRLTGTAAERAALTTNQNFLSETGNATSQLDEAANKYGIEIESTNPLIGETLESFTMALRKRNSPTGEIYAKKYNSSGTLQATSSNYIDASTLPTEGNVVFENKTWNFAGDVSTTYVVNSGTGQNDSTDGSITILAQKFITGHTLIGTKVRSFTVNLKKVGTPTGTVTARIINSSNVEQAAFGTLDIATLTTSAAATTFTEAIASFGALLALKGYSRELEQEADIYAQVYASKNDMDKLKLTYALDKLATRSERLGQELSANAFSDHPGLKSRINQIINSELIELEEF